MKLNECFVEKIKSEPKSEHVGNQKASDTVTHAPRNMPKRSERETERGEAIRSDMRGKARAAQQRNMGNKYKDNCIG